MTSFVISVLFIPLFCSHVYNFKYLNLEEKRHYFHDNAQRRVSTVFDKQEDAVLPKPLLSRVDLQRRSVIPDKSNLKLAAFNVQIFGRKKMATAGVADILVKIILRYDVILIQEIRDSSGRAIMKLLGLVNTASMRGQYDVTISPRLGRKSSKEQYAFLYRKEVLSVKDSYVYDDGQESLRNDTFEREPFIVHFSSTFTNITDFVFVAIHTSPSRAPEEIDELVSVYDDVIKKVKIPDVVILGDLNAACSYMRDSDWWKNRLSNDKRFRWLIPDCVDTTVAGGQCAYDRFVVAGDLMLKAVIESSAGSFEFDEILGMNKTMALRVSDHYPIELQIYSREIGNAVRLISATVEYAFRLKTPVKVSEGKILGLRKTISGFNVTTTYSKSKAIYGVVFSRNFGNKTEGLTAILDIKQEALPATVISLEQIQLAQAKITGQWDNSDKLSDSVNGVVKMVCEIYPSPTCWVAIVLNY